MNSRIFFLLVIILLIFNLSKISAQVKVELPSVQDSAVKKSSYFTVNTNYLSNAVYSGRKDSSIVPYLRGSLGYFHKSGIYAEVGASLLVSPEDTKRIDLVTFSAGYAIKITEKLNLDINATKMYYTDLSYAVQSELKGITGINLGYDAGLFSISGGAELLFSTNTDIFTSFKIAHDFQMGSDLNNFFIAPSVQVNSGTQYYNQAYFTNRKFSFTTTSNNGTTTTQKKGHSKKSTTTGSSSSSTTTSNIKSLNFKNKNQFSILDYELSLPMNYQYKNLGLFAIPTFAIPVNASSYALDGVLTKENISNTFFMEIGIAIKFPTHHK